MDDPNILRKIALELPAYDLISLCVSKKSFYKDICSSSQFWRLKLEKDFPEAFNYILNLGLPLKNPKSTYIRVFTQLSELIEKYTKKFVDYYTGEEMEFSRLIPLNKEKVLQKIYKTLYDAYAELRKMKIKNMYDVNVKNTLKRYIEENNLNEIEEKILLDNLREIIDKSPISRYF